MQAYVIAGGKSSRMGQDKRQLQVRGHSLLEHTCQLAHEATGNSPVLVGDNLPDQFYHRYSVLHDVVKDQGPLGGLVAAFEDCKEDRLLVLATDLPLLTAADIKRLTDVDEAGWDVITLGIQGEPEPLIAIYQCGTLPFWKERLGRGELGLKAGFAELRVKVLEPQSGDQALLNVNYPDDYSRILELL